MGILRLNVSTYSVSDSIREPFSIVEQDPFFYRYILSLLTSVGQEGFVNEVRAQKLNH